LQKRTSRRPRAAAKAAPIPGRWISEAEFARLSEQLENAQATLEAIQSGAVDGVLVKGVRGSQVYSLAGTDQRFRIYVEQMLEGAITVSDDGVILYCNRRFAEMLKLPLERVMGDNIVNYLAAPVWARIGALFDDNREFVKEESELQRTDQSKLAVHVTASRLPDQNEKIACVVITDLTEHKAQQELRLAKDVAEKSNRAKDTFLATLSHELRTPLTPVLMATAALEKNELLPAHVHRDIAMIRRNIELEARLIDDLLDHTRMASGKLELRASRVDIHQVAASTIEICRAELQAKNHQIELQLAAQKTEMTGDPVRLQQVLWNLLRNAIKFTPAGGHIAIATKNPTPGAIVVEVRDSGIGFEAGEAKTIFEPFEQAGRHITREYGGLGLGLAICSSILEAHAGTIRAASRGQNRGATFTVELPLKAVFEPGATFSVPAPAASKVKARLRILLVEDHKDTRLTLQRFLQSGNNDVTPAATAAQALEVAGHQKFDLVVSDLGLPDDGGGLALMRRLRDEHGLTGIAISGYGMAQDVAASLAAGFSHHLTKPFSLDGLQLLIRAMAPRK
jgi:PAS domain S-box-containing protein